MKIIEFLKNLVNTLLDGSYERVRIIKEMNRAFEESFHSGSIDRYCNVSIAMGDPQFAHEMSTSFIRSGFKITVENDMNLSDAEIFEISEYILENDAFIRKLMALGFDTLIVVGKITKRGKSFCLHKFSDLKGYMLE